MRKLSSRTITCLEKTRPLQGSLTGNDWSKKMHARAEASKSYRPTGYIHVITHGTLPIKSTKRPTLPIMHFSFTAHVDRTHLDKQNSVTDTYRLISRVLATSGSYVYSRCAEDTYQHDTHQVVSNYVTFSMRDNIKSDEDPFGCCLGAMECLCLLYSSSLHV